MASTHGTEPLLSPIQQLRAREYAAEELRRAILLRAMGPGERLPAEDELAALLGVSQITARQALRELEGEGLLELRRGRSGGAFVRGVPPIGDGVDRLAELRAASDNVRAALDFRRLLEPEIAAHAARTVDRGGIETIAAARDAVARREDDADTAFMAADTAFHLSIARATGNAHLIDSLEEIQARIAPALEALPESGAWHGRSVEEHAAVVAAIEAGDADAARETMARHIETTARAALLLLDGLKPRRRRRAASGPVKKR
jgi:GntR family transcriptional regulator, transcriptional repressor for pyruvate dehydrogenase complex